MKTLLPSLFAVSLLAPIRDGFGASSADAQNLAGEWRFALDPRNGGVAEKWFARPLHEAVRLPGGLTEQGIGDEVTVNTPWTGQVVDHSYYTEPEYARYRQPGNIKIPFWLQPEKYYAGAAWYQRDIEIPAAWAGQQLLLTLERPHWKTTVWLDDREIGSNDSLSTPHQYRLGADVAAGRHQLTIRVDNSRVVEIGFNSHSITDHTQGNWNGIVGRIDLAAVGRAWIDDLQIHPDIAAKSIRVEGRLGGALDAPVELRVSAADQPVEAQPKPDGTFSAEIPLGKDTALWDEFHPALHRLIATPRGGAPRTVTFGLRTLGVDGPQLTINGRKIFLRGALDCAIFPRTGHPPTDEAEWRRIFTTIQAHGLNHVRFHSWCPPEAAFAVADEMGLYLQIECASWANDSVTIGDGKPVDAWIYAEADRILRAYGNHPSFTFLTYGNEPGGKNFTAYLAKWVSHYQARDSRRLYTSAGGWPPIQENDFHVHSDPRIQHWEEGLASRINARPPETITDYFAANAKTYGGKPVVAHEIGQWCAYPNFAEMSKYTGYLKPRNFEIFRETLAEHHMADQAHDFLLASGKLQALCYKEDIEAELRTKNLAGFQLLGLQDFSGQGTALVGVLDAFWEDKGYLSAAEYRRFCAPTVLLARLDRRVFRVGEKLEARIEIAHFGAEPLPSTGLIWELVADDGRATASGRLPADAIPIGNGTPLGAIAIDLRDVPAPARYRLVVKLDGTKIENDWNVWVYPAKAESAVPAGVKLTRHLDDAALDALAAGGTVLWTIPPDEVRNDKRLPVKFGFSTIFWNTAWTKRQAPTTLGILCDPHSAALAGFPTESHTDWQWWYPIQHSRPMLLDGLPPALRPIIQVIDDWSTNRKLGLVFEAKVGPGRLLVSSIDIENPTDPVTAQLRTSLLHYLVDSRFQPKVEVTPAELSHIVGASPTSGKGG